MLPAPPAAAPAAPARGRTRRSPPELVGDDTGDPESPDLPPSQILSPSPPVDDVRNRQALDGLGKALVSKLATFRIESEIVGMTVGPVVTQFEVSPAPGIKVARIANLDADLALALRAPSVRIVAPIPGKAAVGVEVPNPEPQMVYFRDVLESPAFRATKAQLPLALGKDISGKPYVADLARMPHLLIAGATGSGKSVCVNTIVTSLIYRHSPRSLRLLMVDPKMVELSMYNDLPHLRHPVVTDNSEAAGVLKWAVIEMERRYSLLSHNGVRNLQDFNQRLETGQVMRSPDPEGEEGDPDRWLYRAGPLPYIVLIIDELADLMMTVQGEVEKPLALLAQKARAIGIHLILATQRPSVNVLTGLIKANFPSRIGFRVSSKVDSRTILDQNGADSLLGNGDMLFLPPGQSDPLRIQGAYLSTEETERLMDWYRSQADRRREEEGAQQGGLLHEGDILDIVRAKEGDSDRREADEDIADRDKLFREAAELCIQHQGGSTSLLQRRLRIGYGRAARIIDQLHHAGILGPPDGSKPREVMVDLIQLDQILPED
jgi:DNA segregation ATPase FtsK/SpoIIIE, S-DNA-T family